MQGVLDRSAVQRPLPPGPPRRSHRRARLPRPTSIPASWRSAPRWRWSRRSSTGSTRRDVRSTTSSDRWHGVPDDLNWLTTIAFATHAAARSVIELCAPNARPRAAAVPRPVRRQRVDVRWLRRALPRPRPVGPRPPRGGGRGRSPRGRGPRRLGAPILLARTNSNGARRRIRAGVDGVTRTCSSPPRELVRGRRRRRPTLKLTNDRPRRARRGLASS